MRRKFAKQVLGGEAPELANMREEWVNTMAQNYFQPEIETMPVEEIKKLQSERLVKQVKHIYDNVPFYKNKMDEAGIKPEDIHGIEDLA